MTENANGKQKRLNRTQTIDGIGMEEFFEETPTQSGYTKTRELKSLPHLNHYHGCFE